MGFCIRTLFDFAIGDISPDEAGSASGSLSAAQQLSGGIGITAITSVFFLSTKPEWRLRMALNEHKYPYHFYLRNSVHKIMMHVDSNLIKYDITNQQARVVGFIERIRSASDDRAKEISLTLKGRELIATFNSVFYMTENKIVQGMTEERKKLFLELLKMVVSNFDG